MFDAPAFGQGRDIASMLRWGDHPLFSPVSSPWITVIGEASRPGPFTQATLASCLQRQALPAAPPPTIEAVTRAGRSMSSFTIAVVNPTSILNKSQALLMLGADVVALSETSAVPNQWSLLNPGPPTTRSFGDALFQATPEKDP